MTPQEAIKKLAEEYAEENMHLRNRIAELEGVLDMKQDEYVKQVGTWKIIQRLEEELEVSEGNKKHIRNVLDLKGQVDALNVRLTKRVNELEFGLQKIAWYADAPGGGPWAVRQARALLQSTNPTPDPKDERGAESFADKNNLDRIDGCVHGVHGHDCFECYPTKEK